MNALDWIKQLEGQQAADTYRGAEAYSRPKLQAARRATPAADEAGPGRRPLIHRRRSGPGSHGHIRQGEANREKDPELRRCLELGSSLDACEGLGAMEGMASLLMPFAGKPDPNAPPPVAGVVFIGNYHSRSQLPSLSFGNWLLQPYRTAARWFPTTMTTLSESPEHGAACHWRTSPNPS